MRQVRVLEIHDIPEDFYLNLLDWRQSQLAVGLLNKLVVYDFDEARVKYQASIPKRSIALTTSYVSSVKFSAQGSRVLFGTSDGCLYSVTEADTDQRASLEWREQETVLGTDDHRISTVATGQLVAFGNRKGDLQLYSEASHQPASRWRAHTREICGMEWSPTNPMLLATGGNDDCACLWDLRSHREPLFRYQIKGAVKGLTWINDILCIGGGTGDCTLRLFQSPQPNPRSSVNTGSQVCGLFSNAQESLISVHGYSSNAISAWRVLPDWQLEPKFSLGLPSRALSASLNENYLAVACPGDSTVRFFSIDDLPYNPHSQEPYE